MKKLATVILLLMAFSVSAEPFNVVFSAGAFSVENKTENNSAVEYELPSYGAILSADTNKYFGVDLLLSNKSVSASVKASLDVSNFKFSAGIGLQGVDAKVTDNSDTWNRTTSPSRSQSAAKFVEIAHISGVFLRYSEINYDDTVGFVRSTTNSSGVETILNQKSVTISEKIGRYMLGYKVAF